jgi:hypothetical protein
MKRPHSSPLLLLLLIAVAAPASAQQVRGRIVDERTRQAVAEVPVVLLDGAGGVRADGSTDVPQVRVAPVVYETVAQLRDGDLAPAAVKEGDYWALIWRRGTRPAVNVSVRQAQPEIERQLALHNARVAQQALIEQLRTQHLTEYEPNLLEAINYPREEGIPSQRISTQAKAAKGDPQPHNTDRGDR